MFCEGHTNILGALKLASIISIVPFIFYCIDIWFTNRYLREWKPGLEEELMQKYYNFAEMRRSRADWRKVPTKDRIFYWFLVAPDYYKFNPRFAAKLTLHMVYGVALFVMGLSYLGLIDALPHGDAITIFSITTTAALFAIVVGIYYAVERGRVPSYSYIVVLAVLVTIFLAAIPCIDSRDFIFIFAGVAASLMLAHISKNWRNIYLKKHGQA